MRKDTRLAGLQAALRVVEKFGGYPTWKIGNTLLDLIRAERKKPKKGAK